MSSIPWPSISIYLAMVGFLIVGIGFTVWMNHRIGRKTPTRQKWGWFLGFITMTALMIYLAISGKVSW